MPANGTRAMVDVGDRAFAEDSLKSRAASARLARQIHYQWDAVEIVQGDEPDLSVVTTQRDSVAGGRQRGALNAEVGVKLFLNFHVGNGQARQTTFLVDHHERFAVAKEQACS